MAAKNLDYKSSVYGKRKRAVRRSFNLQGILEHVRQVGIVRVDAVTNTKRPGTAKTLVNFVFADNSHASVKFADEAAACQWVLSRRSWGICRITEYNTERVKVTRFVW